MSSYSFCHEQMFDEYSKHNKLVEYREYLANKFNRNMRLLFESKKPRKQHSNRGRLDTRRVYQYKFNENLFHKTLSQPTSDTTIIMLIDGSGSMDSSVFTYDTWFTRLNVCNAITSAFAKSVKTVLNDELKLEVFLKSSPPTHGKGAVELHTTSPVKVGGNNTGSYTSEYSVLPALLRWGKKNIKTKNVIFFNLTDGEAYSTLGVDGRRFDNTENAFMRTKYLRGENEMTMIIGESPKSRDAWLPVYGENLVMAEDDFDTEMFKTLTKLMESSYE